MDYDEYDSYVDAEGNEHSEYPDWDEESEMSREDTYRGVLHAMMATATGCAFILMMEDEHWTVSKKANYGLYPRYSQPCFGELRKYESSHPGDCTQPHNQKPGDLTHPFPDGKPAALGLPLHQYYRKGIINPKTGGYTWNSVLSDETDKFFTEFFQDDCPWVSGFGGLKNIEFYMHDGHIGGVVLKTCKVDPTVTVQMMWFLRNYHWAETYWKLRGFGLTKHEAYAFLLINNGSTTYVSGSDHYHFGNSLSPKRFLNQKPNELTGGTLEDRFDYNRTDIQDLWCSNFHEGDAIEWVEMLRGEVRGSVLDKEDTIPLAFQKMFHKVLGSEGPIMEVPYVPSMTIKGKHKPDIIFYNNKSVEKGKKAA